MSVQASGVGGGGLPAEAGHNLVAREFKPALRRAKLPQMRFHDLRHTFASLLIAQGEHPKLISEQLGHASVQITLDRYSHLMPQSYDHAGERLEAALFGRMELVAGGPGEEPHPQPRLPFALAAEGQGS